MSVAGVRTVSRMTDVLSDRLIIRAAVAGPDSRGHQAAELLYASYSGRRAGSGAASGPARMLADICPQATGGAPAP